MMQVNRNEKEWTEKRNNWRLWRKERTMDKNATTDGAYEGGERGCR